MLSIIELRSRHSKNPSRACQQWARAFRLGASKAPSVEGLVGLGLSIAALPPTAAELVEAERRPIWCCCLCQGGGRRGGEEGGKTFLLGADDGSVVIIRERGERLEGTNSLKTKKKKKKEPTEKSEG